jgi:hypothetical protein
MATVGSDPTRNRIIVGQVQPPRGNRADAIFACDGSRGKTRCPHFFACDGSRAAPSKTVLRHGDDAAGPIRNGAIAEQTGWCGGECDAR